MNHREVQGRIEIEPDNINTCIKELLSQGVELTDMIVKSPNLENVFLNLTGRELRS
jgi:ABC-2 type transport system ATP-binding protein